MGIVYLVGAGCGSGDLITVRGLRVLRAADAVVYDDLIDPSLLGEAPPDAEIVYVGKRIGKHSKTQPEINRILIRLAESHRLVCRLKGGDPFVFGRGGEEFLALRDAGVDCLEIPGVSSSVAVPAREGTPVTHRSLSRSFHVITAHTKETEDSLPKDIESLAALKGTLVFLMGLKSIGPLTERLRRAGMEADTPAAIMGSVTVRGTLADIAGKASLVCPPAIILVGGTAGLDLFEGKKPPRVGIVGTDRFQQEMRRSLAFIPCVAESALRSRTETIAAPEALKDALAENPTVIAFTSPNGVSSFFELFSSLDLDIRQLRNTSFAAVGPKTAAALGSRGIRPSILPARHYTEALGEALVQRAGNGPVLLCGADNASDAPEKALKTAGIPFARLSLYRTVWGELGGDVGEGRRQPDYLVFGSSSGVETYFSKGGLLPAAASVCIGEKTADAVRRHGESRVLTAEETAADSVAALILHDMAAKQSG